MNGWNFMGFFTRLIIVLKLKYDFVEVDFYWNWLNNCNNFYTNKTQYLNIFLKLLMKMLIEN